MDQINSALSGMIIENELADRDRLDSMAGEAKESGQSFVSLLARHGILSEEKISTFLYERFDLPYVNLKRITIDKAVVDRIPLKIASYYKFVPIKIEERVLTIAVSGPLDVKTRDDIRTYLGFDIDMVLSAEEDIADVLKSHYGLAAETVQEMSGDMPKETVSSAVMHEKVENIETLAGDASVIKLVNQVILEAYRRRATDIHIEPYRGAVKFRYRVDGVLYDVKMHDEIKRFLMPILSRIKIMANMNIVERRLPQDGRAVVKIQDQVLDLRVSSIPTPYGESIVIRILPMKLLFSLERLGMSSLYLDMFKEFIRRPHGIVFITGPTGSGKTTTLYACLNEINTAERKIITIEDPIEYEVEGITQIQVSPEIGLDFARGLRSMLRHDPNVVMVGEVRDLETAEIAIRASLTGHLVFSTLHTNDAASGITRLTDIGVEPYLVASSLEAIIAQRLIRTICPDCKQKDDDNEDLMVQIAEDLNLSSVAGVEMYRGTGCEKCNLTGFYGRTAIYEVFLLDGMTKRMVTKKSSSNELKRQAMEAGMHTLRQDGWQKVLAGITTIEEVMNVTPEDKERGIETVEPAPEEYERKSEATGKAESSSVRLMPSERPAVRPERSAAQMETVKASVPSPRAKTPEEVPAPPPPSERQKITRRKRPDDVGVTKRIYDRAEKKISVRYKFLDDGHQRPGADWSPFGGVGKEQPEEHATTTKDISAGGLLFYADKLIPKGTIMEMSIDLPDGGRAIECLTRVERLEEIKKDGIYGIGVCFLDMSRVDRSRIDKYVKM